MYNIVLGITLSGTNDIRGQRATLKLPFDISHRFRNSFLNLFCQQSNVFRPDLHLGARVCMKRETAFCDFFYRPFQLVPEE